MIRIYEVPCSVYSNNVIDGYLPDKVLEKCDLIVEGEDYKDATEKLVNAINSDSVDEINNYLYINEE